MKSMVKSLYEKLLGLQSALAPSRPPKASASIVPWRRNSDGDLEVYWVRRSPTMRFMGGWYAFPGGGLAKSDRDVPIASSPSATSETTFTQAEPDADEAARRKLGPDLVPGLVACALRELFEETGLLLVDESEQPSPEIRQQRRQARRQLLAKEQSFADLASAHGWQLDASRLVFAGRWLTPPLAPLRFDNRFFLLRWDEPQLPAPDLMGGELDRGEWIAPHQAIESWRTGEVLIAPPILHILEVLAAKGPEQGLESLHQTDATFLGPFRRIEFRPGVLLLPLLTPTLPPARHTNAYVVGRRQAVLIDPATPLAKEQARLLRALSAIQQGGLEITAIWLTHHHPDHVGAVEAARRELAVPVCAHRSTAERLEPFGITVDEELVDGQVVDLGDDSPFPVRVLHTPGHTQGHLCFFAEPHRSLIAGDLTSTLSTIVIDPPDGDMDAYLKSIARMIELEPDVLFPAHGPAIRDAGSHLQELQQHRLEREEQVLASWNAGLRDPDKIVRQIYTDIPRHVHPIAARQIGAHLDRLRQHGQLDD